MYFDNEPQMIIVLNT